MTSYPFDTDFQEEIIALSLKPNFLTTHREALDPSFFTLDYHVEIIRHVLDYFDAYQETPTFAQVRNMLPDYHDVLELIYEKSYQPLDYTKDQVIRFAQYNRMIKFMYDNLPSLKTGEIDLDQALQDLEDIAQLKVGHLGDVIVLNDDIDKVYRRLNDHEGIHSRTETGIKHIDLATRGGMIKGSLGIIMAATSGGKTMVLVNFALHAALLGIHPKNVLYVTCELGSEHIAERFYARLTGRFKAPDEDTADYTEALKQKLDEQVAGNIVIKAYSPGTLTVTRLRKDIAQLERDYGFFDEVIVDYVGEMNWRVYKAKRDDEKKGLVITDLIAMAKDLNKKVWTAVQANREGVRAKFLSLDHIAESYQQAMKADVLIGLSQTQMQLANKEATMTFLKNRLGTHKGARASIKFDPSRMFILSQTDHNGNPMWIQGETQQTHTDQITEDDYEDLADDDLLSMIEEVIDD